MKTKAWFENKFIPTVSKLGNQRHLSTIRDAFAIFTPIIIAGAFAVLWRSVIFNTGGGKGTLSGIWASFNDYKVVGQTYTDYLSFMNHWMLYVQVGTINVMSIYVSFGIGYFLSISRGSNSPVIAGLVSMASFFAVTNMMISGSWESGMYWLGPRGLISAIIIGLLMTELFCWLSKDNKLAINMPAGVPPAVSRAFAKLFPAILTLAAAGFINLLIWFPFYIQKASIYEGVVPQFTFKANPLYTADQLKALAGFSGADAVADIATKPFVVVNPSGDAFGFALKTLKENTDFTKVMVNLPVTGGDVNLTSAIYCGVVAPFTSLASSTSGMFGIALLYVMLVSFFWFFGLHGTNIINGAFNPIWLILYAQNVAGADHVFVQGTFDAYVFIGGWGATLPLIIATLIFGRKGSPEREVSKFALGPGIFQINEPVTFGYPLILNAILAIPLFFIMPVLVVTTYMGIQWFGVPKVKVLIPWTMPVGFGGLIASASPWGFVLAVVNMLIASALWTPFVFLMKSKDSKELAAKALQTEEGKRVVAKAAIV